MAINRDLIDEVIDEAFEDDEVEYYFNGPYGCCELCGCCCEPGYGCLANEDER